MFLLLLLLLMMMTLLLLFLRARVPRTLADTAAPALDYYGTQPALPPKAAAPPAAVNVTQFLTSLHTNAT